MLRAGKYIGTFKRAILASMIDMRLGGVELQEANKAWRESASKPKVQMCAANPQLVRRVLLAGLVHSRHRFDQSILGWLSSAIQLEHTLAHRKRVWIGRHRIKAETHLGRRAVVYLYVCALLLCRVCPRTSISARRLFSRNPQGHNHVFGMAFSESAFFVKEPSRLSEQSLIGSSGRGFKLGRIPFGTIQLGLNFIQLDQICHAQK